MGECVSNCKTRGPHKILWNPPPFCFSTMCRFCFSRKGRTTVNHSPRLPPQRVKQGGHHVNIIDSAAPAVLSRTPVPPHTPPSAAIQNNSGQFESNTSAHLCSKYLTLVVLSDLPQVIPQFSLSRNCFLCAAARSHAPARLLFHRAAFCGMVLVTFACGFLRLRPWSCRRKIEVTA